MASRNKAKRQQGSFLTRGRQQVQRRQQLRQQSSRQLPPQGGTSAGSPKATAQRVTKAVTERARMDVARTRALADMMQRNVDRNARAEGVREGLRMTSGNTRYVPPGGENARGPKALPPAQTPKALPPARSRPAQSGPVRSSIGKVSGPASNPNRPPVRPQPTGPVRPSIGNVSGPATSPKRPAAPAPSTAKPSGNFRAPSLPKSLQNKINSKPAGPIGASTKRGMVGEAAIAALGQAAVSPIARAAGRKLGEALRPLARALDDSLPGVNSRDEANRRLAKTPLEKRPNVNKLENSSRGFISRDGRRAAPTGSPIYNDWRQRKLDNAKRRNAGITGASPTRPSSSGTTSSRSASTPSRSRVSGARAQSSQSPKQSTNTPKAPSDLRISASTANRETGNYGTSGTNNKLIDSWMRDRMRQRESAANEAAMTDAEKSKLAEINKKKKEQKK